MNKAEYRFHKDRKDQILEDEKPNKINHYWEKSKPIYIPKRKKFKRK